MEMQNTGGYVVGWLTLSLINAGLAQAKGLDGGIAWLASIFLGPIVTLLIVIHPPSGRLGANGDPSSGDS